MKMKTELRKRYDSITPENHILYVEIESDNLAELERIESEIGKLVK